MKEGSGRGGEGGGRGGERGGEKDFDLMSFDIHKILELFLRVGNKILEGLVGVQIDSYLNR